MSEENEKETEPVKPANQSEALRREVSASTIARMMGVATKSELDLLEGKIDVLASKINSVFVKIEKIHSLLSRVPTASDLERIDLNIATLKTLIRESLAESRVTHPTETTQETNIVTLEDDDEGAFEPRILTNQATEANEEHTEQEQKPDSDSAQE